MQPRMLDSPPLTSLTSLTSLCSFCSFRALRSFRSLFPMQGLPSIARVVVPQTTRCTTTASTTRRFLSHATQCWHGCSFFKVFETHTKARQRRRRCVGHAWGGERGKCTRVFMLVVLVVFVVLLPRSTRQRQVWICWNIFGTNAKNIVAYFVHVCFYCGLQMTNTINTAHVAPTPTSPIICFGPTTNAHRKGGRPPI